MKKDNLFDLTCHALMRVVERKQLIYLSIKICLLFLPFWVISCTNSNNEHKQTNTIINEKYKDSGRKFVEKNKEGVELLFTVLSEKDKTVKVSYTSNSWHDNLFNKPLHERELWDDIITIPNEIIGYSVVQLDDDAFSGCRKLKSVIIPNSVISIGKRAFHNCNSIESITIPPNIITINEETFLNCSSLKKIDIPNSICELGIGAFSGCENLSSILIPHEITIISKNLFSGCSSLTSVDIPNKVTNIGEFAFWGCDKLNNIVLPNSVITIEPHAFAGCHNLDVIKFSDNLINIGEEAFEYTNIKSIIIPQHVSYIGAAAFDNNYVENISVDPRNKKYDSRDNCNAIIETKTNKLVISSNKTIIPKSVKIIGSQSFIYSNLKKILLPEGLEIIDTMAFMGAKISSLQLPQNLKRINYAAFSGCNSLKEISIPKNVKIIESDIFQSADSLAVIIVDKGNMCFDSRNGCNGIIETQTNTLLAACKKTIIPMGVLKISSGAFRFNTEIESIELPSSIEDIEPHAFAGCSKLNNIISHINPPFPIDAFSIFDEVKLNVPKDSKQLYQKCEGWNNFNKIIEF